MSAISSLKTLNTSDTNNLKNKSSLFRKADSLNFVYKRSDDIENEKSIPDIFNTSEFQNTSGVSCLTSVVESDNDIPNIFKNNEFQADSLHSYNDNDNIYDYPKLFTLHQLYLEPCSFKDDFREKYRNYTNVFSLSDIQPISSVQHLNINNSDDFKHKNTSSISSELYEDSFKGSITGVNEPCKSEKCSFDEERDEMSSALCFWYIFTGTNIRDHNIKTYFPQREISSINMMKDIKLMLINLGTTYFLVDEETHMYKPNGNISMAGLTPEMFESAIDPILECSNLYKMLRCSINKWKDMCDDNIAKAFIFAVSNILDDYERTIYSISHESLLLLVGRLSYITPKLQLLANICFLKVSHCIGIPERCGIKLFNKIHKYLFDYQFLRDSFLKMLLYIFESCCLAYFRVLSNWALKGILNDKESGMFIQSKPNLEDEDIDSRMNWNGFIIDESIEIPIFLVEYKNDILLCGKTINFYKQFNDLNVFLPGLTCCFDSVDTQKVYEKFITYFKYNSSLKTTNLVKKMSNCYLFESATVKPVYSGINTDIDGVQYNKLINGVGSVGTLSNDNYEFFSMPDWTSDIHTYDFNKPYGFFTDDNGVLMYNGKRFDIIDMIDYVPHSILIPARILKNVCEKQILDLFFVEKNLMGCLYYLSQLFFLMSRQFSSKLCDTLFDDIICNRQKPLNVFNPVKLKSILDEAIQYSFSDNKPDNFKLEVTFMPYLNGIIDISDVECIELNYLPEWPMNMILSDKVLLKYSRMFMFACKLDYVSWSLFKARELLSEYKNDTGLQLRKINLFKYCMTQFVSSIQQYYRQVVVSTCWSELNENFENAQNYDDLFVNHKQYMHQMLRRCFMVVGLKDKLILLNKIYIEILAYYQALASGQFYIDDSERLHSKFISMEQSFYQFVKLRDTFYSSILKTVQTNTKHYVVQLETLVTILGPSCSST